jgi:hypothetical protein
MQDQITQIIGSAGFAITLVALVRKYVPKLDSYAVLIAYAIVAGATYAIAHYSAQIPPAVLQALLVVATLIAGPGVVSLAQQIATKGASTRTLPIVVASSDPSITLSDSTGPTP